MKTTFHPAKSQATAELRGFGFEIVDGFDWTSARYSVDTRRNYGEVREIAIGHIDDAVYTVVFTRRGDALHIISVRRASRKERRAHAQT